MVSAQLLAWVYGGLLVIVHYWGEELTAHPYASIMTPFSAGVTVSYAFLELLPMFHEAIPDLGRGAFFALLVGFSFPHVVEASIMQHRKSVEEIRHEFKEVHTVFMFAYYTIIGALIYVLLQRSIVGGTLLFIPVLLHTMISSVSLTELHDDIMDNPFIQAVVLVSVLIGIGIAALLPLTSTAIHLLLGLITGLFLYIVISDAISQKAEGDVRAFIAGLTFYSGVIVALWQLL